MRPTCPLLPAYSSYLTLKPYTCQLFEPYASFLCRLLLIHRDLPRIILSSPKILPLLCSEVPRISPAMARILAIVLSISDSFDSSSDSGDTYEIWVKVVVMDRGGSFRPSHSTHNFTVFTTPLISNGDGSNPPEASGNNNSNLPRRASIHGAARFLRRASGRRMLREPSRLVREAVVDELEERQMDWAYSRSVVVLDFLWNLVFVCIVVVVLSLSTRENPRTPLRVWIVGYALQCALHMVCVWFEYRRHLSVLRNSGGTNDFGFSLVSGGNASREDEFEVNDQVSREHASI